MLSQQREKIDQLDQQIVALLEERMTVVTEVARIKAENQLAILDGQREEALLAKIRHYVKDDQYEESIVEVYQAMLLISKNYQRKTNGK
ncbi:chorismate mutase [Vagococcus sp. BWB3-3]|uniref:Chorismate mutase n=1 Tax=Vagococcus allomyrinae TaxID=2794353 RepID=A0A940P9Z6_9ENTE|nr:chorismate mutase [Vagococcus allomyrinae]MBP1044047.1 chorismate mutase [Vagococcus allomyrinae]